MEHSNLEAVLERHKMNKTRLAGVMNVDKSTVTRWCQKKIPAERVADVSRATGISSHELRPDIFPAQTGAA